MFWVTGLINFNACYLIKEQVVAGTSFVPLVNSGFVLRVCVLLELDW
jgi:hypothetical protein